MASEGARSKCVPGPGETGGERMAFGPPQGNVSDVESKKGIRQKSGSTIPAHKACEGGSGGSSGPKARDSGKDLCKVDQRAPVKGLAPRLSIWGQRRPYGIQIPS